MAVAFTSLVSVTQASDWSDFEAAHNALSNKKTSTTTE